MISGLNVLAVEAHQVSASSSDLHFELEVRAVRETPVAEPEPQGLWRTTYYDPAGVRLAVREGHTSGSAGVYLLLGDHLGSTSVVVNSNGTLHSKQLYKPWGQSRYTSPTALPTDYQYTGQRNESDLGLYYYGARWYEPGIGHFIQADSIIPGAGSPQAWDRFSYTLNNPLNYVDPSGHRPCEGTVECSSGGQKPSEAYYVSFLQEEYGWSLNKDGFSYRETKVIYDTAQVIRNYASSQTAGRGKEWMNRYLHPYFTHNLSSAFSWVPLPGRMNNVVLLSPAFANSPSSISHVTHELGHVLDNATGEGIIPATWGGGGWGDALARYAGIQPTGFRAINGTSNMREGMAWSEPRVYGNRSTAEYFASTFEYAVNSPQHPSAPVEAIIWLNVMVSLSMVPLP